MSEKNNLVINEGIRAEERHFCLLCDCKGTVLYQDLRDRLFAAPGIWTQLRCPKCGLVWLNPQPIPEDIGKLYSEYFTHDTLPENPKKKPTESWRDVVGFSILNSAFGYRSDGTNKTIGWLASRLGPLRDIAGGAVMWLNGSRPGKLLDVGCGNGRFLDRMRELGWEVVGVEPDKQAAKVARKRFGLDVHEDALEEIAFPDDTFDAITMSHVVEHLPDPINTIRECQRILKKGGRLVVTVPNIESLGHRLYREAWRGLEVPRHLFLFSPPTLRDCVERSGLQVLRLWTTARTARMMWAGSRLIRRNETLLSISPKQRLRLRLEGLVFQALEHGLCMIRDAGEEVVMIAGKGDEV
jgi:2-polyprenyl-3-methyl-5-hydroxy-6-metoxy-1,4-benzoquinol methylase